MCKKGLKFSYSIIFLLFKKISNKMKDYGGEWMKSRYSVNKIIEIIKEHENGRSVQELSREYGICTNTFYRWKNKYGGLEASDAKRLKELEDENRRLKKLVAEKELHIDALKSVVTKKY